MHAVDGVDLEVFPGETVGLVGETGCGKSTLAKVITKLHEPTAGTLAFDGEDYTHYSRQADAAAPPADADDLPGPVRLAEPPQERGRDHRRPLPHPPDRAQEAEIKPEVQQLMELVGLNPEHYNRYAHEFSGGQRQRIGVARALALKPRLIVCDEPVSALDVSIQAQILNLLEDLQAEFHLTYLFIAHDLSVVRHVSDRIVVMYLGKMAEIAPKADLYRNPKHPYTGTLLSAVPIPDPDRGRARQRVILQGDVPSPIDPPTGCRFHPRCPKAQFPTLPGGAARTARPWGRTTWPPATSR